MKELPQYEDINKTGNLAVTYIQSFFEEQGWIFRRADGSTDFGVDAEIEIVDKNSVTGKLFKCQIKGTEVIDWKKDSVLIQVKATTWRNWKEINIPVIAFLANVLTKEIFWTLPLAVEPKNSADTVSLHFVKENNLKTEFYQFRAIIKTWLEAFPKKNILREVPLFHKMYIELEASIDWGDPWCEIDEEMNSQARIFYNHVLELRLSTGLTNEKIFPFEFWLIRNQGLWDDVTLYHGTFSELMKYIKDFYLEAFSILTQRVKNVDLSFENNEIINYFQTLERKTNSNEYPQYSGHSFWHPLANDLNFHKLIEKALEQKGVLKFKWSQKRQIP